MSELRQAFESLSVVIPAYNAERHIGRTLDIVEAWLSAQGVPHEIIVVDDGSTDRTAELVVRLGERVSLLRNETNRGKGYSVRRGVLASNNAWILTTDADNAIGIEHLATFAAQAPMADIVIASRNIPGAALVHPQPRLRVYTGKVFTGLMRLVALPDCSDSQCGFKLYRRGAAQLLFSRQRVDRFAFDVEVLLLARRMGLRVAESPVTVDNPPHSSIRLGVDSLKMCRDMIRIMWRLRRSSAGSIENRSRLIATRSPEE
jgi:dolichyl-phosphate beta-glucosyltransferase